MLPEADQEKGPAGITVTEVSSEGHSKQSSLPSCTSDGVLDLCDESVGNSERLDVREQVPENETREQQT